MVYSLPAQVKKNPEIRTPIPGIRGWKIGSPTGLVVFFEIAPGTVLPEHSHCFQWGTVLDGELELTIGGDTAVFRRGDGYVIPEGVPHSGRIDTGCLVMDYFADPGRY